MALQVGADFASLTGIERTDNHLRPANDGHLAGRDLAHLAGNGGVHLVADRNHPEQRIVSAGPEVDWGQDNFIEMPAGKPPLQRLVEGVAMFQQLLGLLAGDAWRFGVKSHKLAGRIE